MSEPTDPEVAILNIALEMPADQRAGYLREACGDNPALRQRVEGLLQAHDQAGDFLQVLPAGLHFDQTIRLSIPSTEKPGDKIGRYKLLQQIGEGGCGVVYMAEQEEPVRRRVALKVIKLGMDTKQVIARFEAERQALALMDHPNIAKVLDAGATDTGRPYFVMELVRGIKITDLCDENKISTEERLKLFIQVCQAIQHAHQKGIIHRDIKPSNILVTVNDGAPTPKVIDFGIAKATQGRLTDQTLFTAFEQFLGTPAYMSPEQAVMTSQDIDTRSDIYSLGVLLYELLTSRTPFDQKELLAAGLDEMRRTIREKEPPRPSTRLSAMTNELLTTTAQRHRTDAPKLIHILSGDLDWIVMKCLEKDRTRRYATANGLAMDVERHLRNEAIEARPPSKIYRFQKLVRRNKLAFAAISALALALSLGVVVSSMQAIRATRAEARAMRLQKQAEAINRFLTEDLLYQATPDQNASGEDVTMKEVLEKAARKLDQDPRIAAEPEVEARLRMAVGNTYFRLGVLAAAEDHLRRSVALWRASRGPLSPNTLAAQEALAWLLVGGLRNFEEGEQLSRETWQARTQVLGPEHRDTLDSMDTYGTALVNQRQYEKAEEIYRECLKLRGRVLGTNDADFLITLGNLAQLLSERGNLAEAEQAVRDVIERRNRAGLGDSVDTLANICNLAVILLRSDRLDDAERLLVDARRRAIKKFGAENPVSTLHIQHALARVWAGQKNFKAAENLAAETLAIYRRVSPGHESTGKTLLILGRVLVEQDKLDEAEKVLQEALLLFRERYSMKPELAAQAENWLGAIKVARQDFVQAENLLLAGAEQFFIPTVILSKLERQIAVGHIVEFYEKSGKPDQASMWRRRLESIGQTPAK